jgi:periplasmic mercuric ion binding protein
MKTQSIILSISFLFIFGFSSFAQADKKESIKVWGNCGMCKKTIETAATKAGASNAKWDTETKMLAVSYNGKKTSAEKIQQAIAAAGYDTRDFTASNEAYDKLHGCCQYDRKADATATKKESCCNGDTCKKDEAKKDCCKEGDACKKDGCCKS